MKTKFFLRIPAKNSPEWKQLEARCLGLSSIPEQEEGFEELAGHYSLKTEQGESVLIYHFSVDKKTREKDRIAQARNHINELARIHRTPKRNIHLNFLTYEEDLGRMCLQRLGVPDNGTGPMRYIVCDAAYTMGMLFGTPISSF
jgi:hypothetical protein